MARDKIEACWNLVETGFKSARLPYAIMAYLVGSIIYLIYVAFSIKVRGFHTFDTINNLLAAAMGITIAFQLAAIQNILNKTRWTLEDIDKLFLDSRKKFGDHFKNRLTGSIGYYFLIIASITVPFVILNRDIKKFYIYEDYNYWALGLDYYNFMLGLISLFLLSTILWILINIVWSLNEISYLPKLYLKDGNVFNIMIKLRPIKSLLSITIFYYFVSISLIIITYVCPDDLLTNEMFLLVVLLIAGAILFFVALESIQRIVNFSVENELYKLGKIRDQNIQILESIKNDKSNDCAKEIDLATRVVESMRKEILLTTGVDRGVYDIRTIGTFISSLLIPVLSLVKELNLLPI